VQYPVGAGGSAICIGKSTPLTFAPELDHQSASPPLVIGTVPLKPPGFEGFAPQ
jgi:hypothetical protein